MAASGFTPISLYYSTTASAVPLAANLANGELALNTADMKLYSKNSAGVVTLLAANITPVANGGTGITSTPTNGQIPIGNGTTYTAATLTAGTGVTITNASGSITINATGTGGTVTSVAATVPSFLSIAGSPITSSGTLAISLSGTALPTTSGGTGLTSFTANGVVYASSTSALTTGSALTFNGNALGVTGTGGASAINLTDATSHVGFTATPATGGGFYLSNNRVGSSTFFRTSNASGSDTIPMTFLSGGNVGIGTSSPAYKLDVYGTVSLGDPTVSGSARQHFVRTGGAVTANTTNGLTFKPGSGSVTDQFVRFETGGAVLIGAIGNVADSLSIWTRDTSNAITITQAGNLGIGATPSQRLTVAGAINLPTDATNPNSGVSFWSQAGVGATLSGLNVVFNTGSNGAQTQRFQIGSAGQFGIGATPSYGTSGQVFTSGGSGAAPTWTTPASGGGSFSAKTTTYTAVSGDNILADTSSASWTLTLPATPTTGNSVQIMDSKGTFGQYPLTVARNGSTIMSAAENMTLDVNGAATTFVYNGTTWRVI